MARGVNKVILVGNLGQDPEPKYTQSGSAVVNLSLATTDSWKDRNTGQQQERTEWHRLVFFGRLAEIVAQYLRKGSQVYVEGRLQTRKWQGQDGQDRYTTEVVVNDMQMLGGRAGGDAPQAGGYQQAAPQANSFDQTPQYNNQPAAQQAPAQGGFGAPQPASAPNTDGFDDDIPF